MEFSIRASAAPLAILCGQSQRGELQVQESNPAATLGSAVHEILAAWVGRSEWRQPDQIAAVYGCDPDDLEWLAESGRRIWASIKSRYPAPLVEMRLEAKIADDVTLTGTLDVASMLPGGARVLDWKSGRARRDHTPQLCAYASLATRALGVDRACVSIIYLRASGVQEEWTVRKDELAEFEARLVASLKSETYNTGEHCAFCPRAHSCPGRGALVSCAVADLLGAAEPLDAVIQAGRLGELLDVCRAAETAVARIKDGLKDALRMSGPIRSNGTLVSIAQRERRSVDVSAAWPVLREWLGDDLAAVLSISMADAERLVASRTTHGSKAARKVAFAAALEDAGAIKRQTYEALEVKKEVGE